MSDNNKAVPIIDVYWEGPTTLEKINKSQTSGHCLYQVYGAHPLYGPNSLLYIGKTEQSKIILRLNDHKWINNQADECKVFIATCAEFTNWENWEEDDRARYDVYNSTDITISDIESLLIYAHQPSYNSQSLKSINVKGKSFRLFNSGRRASLLPEISTQYYIDPTPNRPSENDKTQSN